MPLHRRPARADHARALQVIGDRARPPRPPLVGLVRRLPAPLEVYESQGVGEDLLQGGAVDGVHAASLAVEQKRNKMSCEREGRYTG